MELLCSIAGVKQRTAEVIIAELGTDLSAWPSARHLCSWAALCPGNDESAGKRRSGRTRKGNRWLRAALLQAAWAAIRTKGSYFGAQFRRIAKRRGEKRAAVAVAHSLLTVIDHVLTRGVFYEEPGAAYFDRLEPGKVADYHRRRLEELGYEVRLKPSAGHATPRRHPPGQHDSGATARCWHRPTATNSGPGAAFERTLAVGLARARGASWPVYEVDMVHQIAPDPETKAEVLLLILAEQALATPSPALSASVGHPTPAILRASYPHGCSPTTGGLLGNQNRVMACRRGGAGPPNSPVAVAWRPSTQRSVWGGNRPASQQIHPHDSPTWMTVPHPVRPYAGV